MNHRVAVGRPERGNTRLAWAGITRSAARPRSVLLFGILAAAAALRIAAADNDLWLDEIWSILWLQSVDHPIDVLRITHDNNHILNTLYLALIGPERSEIAYRGLALVSGMALLVALGVVAKHHARSAELFVVGIAALSTPLVLYGSEARGYAPAALFAVLAFLQMKQREMERAGAAARFGVWVVAGLLSHLSFIYVYLALFGWSLVRVARGDLSSRSWATVMRFHALPIMMLAVLAVWVSRMSVGSGREHPAGSAALVAAQELLGMPGGMPAAILSAFVVLAAATFACVSLWRRGSDEWVFFLLLAIAPAAVILWFQPVLVYPRYFFVLAPFALLLIGYTLAEIWRTGRTGQVLAVMGAGLIAVGQVPALASLLTDGRGHYRDLLSHVATETETDEIRIAGYHDAMVHDVLRHYERVLPGDKRLRFIPKGAAQTAEWYVGGPDAPEPAPAGFQLVRVFPGRTAVQQWHLYRGAH